MFQGGNFGNFPAIVFLGFFWRTVGVWFLPECEFFKEKVLELRTGNFEETPRGSSLQRQFLARALSWTHARRSILTGSREKGHTFRGYSSHIRLRRLSLATPGRWERVSFSVPGGRVCASRVSRVEARYPLVRVGDCERRRCGVGSNSFGRWRHPRGFPETPSAPSSPPQPSPSTRPARARRRGSHRSRLEPRVTRAYRANAFERAARPRANARPGRFFFVSTAFESNGIDGNARKKREVRGPGVGPRDARDDPHRLTRGSPTSSRSLTTGSSSDRRAREGRARR